MNSETKDLNDRQLQVFTELYLLVDVTLEDKSFPKFDVLFQMRDVLRNHIKTTLFNEYIELAKVERSVKNKSQS